jgi:YbbR domain-containing protein
MKNKILYALLATFISFGLWLYVVTVVNPEFEDTFYNIPVVLENEEVLRENGFMVMTDEIPKVTLKLSGNRTDMVKLNSSNITLKADLSKINSDGVQSIGYSIAYPGDLLNNAFVIVAQTPKQITLNIAQWKSKEVDVQVSFTGAVPEQYIAFKENATLDNPRVTVTGPAAIIDNIATAQIQVSLDNRTESILDESYTFVLLDAQGKEVDASRVKTDVTEVRYSLKIQRWKDIELRLDVLPGGGLTAEDCQIIIDPVTIRVSGSDQVLDKLDYLVLNKTPVDLGLLKEDFTHQYEIVMPEEVTNLSEKSTANVTVQLPDMELRQFTVTDIRSVNVPAGMKVALTTLEKTVEVRGFASVLDTMTEANLFILVDFSGAQVGMGEYKATVYMTAGLEGSVGVVGIYTVTATVSGA